jgi:hypothetical protein
MRETQHMHKPLSEARLVVSGHDVAMVCEGELVSVLSRPGQGYLSFVVDLPQMLGKLISAADAAKTFAYGLASAKTAAEVDKKRPIPVDGRDKFARGRKSSGPSRP